MTQQKVCSKCKESKLVDRFSKNKSAKDGLQNYCKDCHNIEVVRYRKTVPGLIADIYSAQKTHSKRRGMNAPTYNKIEFENWILKQPNFNGLFKSWVDSGYKKMLKPSVDRLDDYMPYTMSNIRLITWKENNSKYYKEAKAGINRKTSKAVISYNKTTKDTIEYYSAREASRRTGIQPSHIAKCCKGKAKTAGKLQWKYKEDIEQIKTATGIIIKPFRKE